MQEIPNPNEGDLRVWHIPQIPGAAFYVPVTSPEEAIKILDVLAEYDSFQFENRIKPHYCNAAGLNVYEDGEWTDWYSPDGEDIDRVQKERSDPLTRLRAHLAALAPLLETLKPGDDAEPRERQEWMALRDAVERAGSCAENLEKK